MAHCVVQRLRKLWAKTWPSRACISISQTKAAFSAEFGRLYMQALQDRNAQGAVMSQINIVYVTWSRFSFVAMLLLGLSVLPQVALADCSDPAQSDAAMQPSPDTIVGDCVLNPTTGERATVTDILLDDNGLNTYALTDAGDLILTRYQIGDQIACIEPEVESGICEVYVVVASNTNVDTMLVDSVELQLDPPADPDNPDPPVVESLVQNGAGDLDSEADENASTPGLPQSIPEPGDAGRIDEQATGSGGSNGAVAYGVRICFPLIGCVNIGRRGSDGGDGDPGPMIDRTVAISHGAIRSDEAAGADGILLTSIGGDGGTGSRTVISNFGPYDGGDGGNGGQITLNNFVDVTTTMDDSNGIRLLSASGRGGDGGNSVLGTGGGAGGQPTTGGEITVENFGDISTFGDNSHGIYALSVGGDAGNGGTSWGIVGRSGSGSFGGNGGEVTINNSARIETQGDNSHGILGQSIGGTGGSAGDAGGLIVALGGTGNEGGTGGMVTIRNETGGSVSTSGDLSIGLLGQSIGGGGGDGGDVSSIVSLGSNGSGGGSGGAVTIENLAGSTVTTSGNRAHAILAQSIGGGGGNAGNSAGLVAIGGSAGAGSDGGTVDVTNDGVIATSGDGARGIFAQSIGGGGGTGSAASGLVAIGGSGGAVSNAANVTITNSGQITTLGERAIAIQAQSIGGGGGDGGSANGSITVGGSGGDVDTDEGSVAGNVTVTQTGLVSTSGDDAIGILAQAVGGGGGNGGPATSGGIVTGAAIGGDGGEGGDGGVVDVTLGETDSEQQSQISTAGDRATGILAQSIGGSGGNGAGAVQASAGSVISVSTAIGGAGSGAGDGAAASLNGGGTISTRGDNATGILLQSVGGGGGNGGTTVAAAAQLGPIGAAVSTAVGASAGGGGNGGIVTSVFDGSITTLGAGSSGYIAQSIGGGGGNGGTTVGAALNVSAAGGVAVSTAIGGAGGSGGIGREVTITVGSDASQTIFTAGEQSTGVLVQSVGGGGGNGGLSVAGAVSGSVGIDGAVSTAIGGAGATAGIGNAVDLTVGSNVITEGDLATGIVAQSIGGGGGTGGTAIGASATLSAVGGLAVSTTVGGSAGGGGNGGQVDAVIGGLDTNQILTSGDRAAGLLVQSVGGGGGTGGTSIASALSVGLGAVGGGISTAIGGSGGQGGNGGNVDARVASTVVTAGEASDGVIVQSIGGGGGNGGISLGAAVSGGGVGAASISTALGGTGDAAGNGGRAALDFDGNVETQQDNSAGLLVQSVGGGGGNGGGSIAASLAGSPGLAFAVATGIGGSGGGGGDGGLDYPSDSDLPESLPEEFSVVLDTDGIVTTRGDNASGMLAQSVGGGGGNGGYSVAASAALAGAGGGALAVGIGGSGSGGGDGKAVSLASFSDVQTFGRDSAGITAQSIGGGGGNGGYNVSATLTGVAGGGGAVSVGVGGSGAGGGDGGKVVSVSNGTITTEGERSVGFLTQSVGGGGGNGGASIAASVSGASSVSAALSVAVGGSGDGGGDGALVSARSTGDIVTLGNQSVGVLAQSVGGGGGNGGTSVAGGLSFAGGAGGAGAIGIGGSGAGGGDGGLVQLDVANNVTTIGDNSSAVVAQSVGGGGGNGGIAIGIGGSGASGASLAAGLGIGGSGDGGGDGQAVVADIDGVVTTAGTNAVGVLAQSVGGGGGNGGIGIGGAVSIGGSGSGAAAIGVGGSGGGGGNGGDVNSRVAGYVQTTGNDAIGVLTQSVGGGGGNGATAIGAAISGGTTSGAVAIAVGGAGSGGGDGLVATSEVSAGVVTTGDRSNAVLTQSVGGGGGNGGVSVASAVSLSQGAGGALGIGVGGFGDAGGMGGAVFSTIETTDDDAQIGTTGDQASAIVAQSVGGGGGNGGLNVSGALSMTSTSGAAVGIGVGGFGGGGGAAGEVILDVVADVITEGNDSHGILAQSLGGGGGNGGINVAGAVQMSSVGSGAAAAIGVGGFGGTGGDAGFVEVNFQGAVSARPVNIGGVGSHGIVAQSIAGGGGNGGINLATGLAFTSSTGTGDGNALVLGVGGFGGGGGNAGDVGVFIGDGSRVAAAGDDRSAIFAQSVGGGGGNGGINVSAGIASDAALVFGMGGFGGAAGEAGLVTVDSGADVFAEGHNAHGIFAQSVGGGGGNGGLNVSGALTFSEQTSVPTITFGMGGFGGAGNVSGIVDVTQRGTVMTAGDHSHGIFAQSIAGGGGNGGLNISNALNFSGATDTGAYNSMSIVAGIGGHGGDGANAGNALVTSSGNILTSGDYARGIFAQSIGGGGGNGGINFSGNLAKRSSLITMGIGGFGAGAGNAGMAQVLRGTAERAAGAIVTDGIGAIGIEATSIGGGGGDAGANIVAAIVLADEGVDEPTPDGETRQQPRHEGVDDEVFTNYDAVLAELNGRDTPDAGDSDDNAQGQSPFALQLAVGGAGGGAGDGGVARVDNFGDIQTLQARSHGILAQSIGGGGGNASYNMALRFLDEDARSRGMSLSLGGATGDGGIGRNVDVIHEGAIETFGADAYGIIAQSIGGGGGNVGAEMDIPESDAGKLSISIGRRGGSGGTGGNVTLSSAGSVVTHGDRAWGLLAQSIGNGGGNSSATTIAASGENRSASMSIGLEGGEGGNAGTVNINVAGLVATEGDDAHAVFAQSVGGGGGNGGDAGSSASSAAISMGGNGGEGGEGGSIDVISNADIVTLGRGAMGIIGQSIGGGGGNGGKSEATISGNAAALAINLGGDGGDGAFGADVDIRTTGTVMTAGDDAHAVFAQSLGGGGGNGSMTLTSIGDQQDTENTGPQMAMAVGGAGGEGAVAGIVTVTNSGSIQSEGDRSSGIFAQSIGGGGGNASQVINVFSSVGAKVSLGLGGVSNAEGGGQGGEGGSVMVENLVDENGNVGRIVTTGNDAHGIVAMSIGGGGGNGSSVSSALADDDSDQGLALPEGIATSINIGGEGGTGGTSGLVIVINDGEIFTLGDGSHGIFAQSIGGGGGNGGVVTVETASPTRIDAPIERSMSVGGSGGSGNFSGDVVVENRGDIDVSGYGAYGVLAQSIGGGGGNGGAANVVVSMSDDEQPGGDAMLAPSLPSFMDVALGGNAGLGADSGNVTVDHSGSIVSRGNNSYGIFAQSVAGGGGTAGASFGSAIGAARDILMPVTVGSRDGGTGTAGTVTVNTTGNIIMLGDNSRSYNVQSVNGGGGNLHASLDVSRLTADEDADDVASIDGQVTVGSSSVEQGNGSDIGGGHDGDLMTLGRNATASSTQSIGGGGGSGQVDITTNSDTATDLQLTLGGSDSVNSAGGNINLTRNGDVMTAGANAAGTSVQSIGGGGGMLIVDVVTLDGDEDETVGGSGDDDAAEASKQRTADLIKLEESSAQQEDGTERPVDVVAVLAGGEQVADTDPVTARAVAGAMLSLGANASTENDGGDISLTFSGDHATEGATSTALLVQSIGGGGGDARLLGLDAVDVLFGGTNGASGDGGNIELNNTGDVFTRGTLSHGIVLQSIGGGGGLALTDIDVSTLSWALSDANEGSGGNISFVQNGDVLVAGERSVALIVQSLGGGGGILDTSFMGSAGGSGSSGNIMLDLNGSLMAIGDEGVGLFAQSLGSDGMGDIDITLKREHVIYGGENGIAISLSGGTQNLLTNNGTIATADGIDGLALRSDGGVLLVNNFGSLVGNVALSVAENALFNATDAQFVAGNDVDLGGTASLLTNAGLLAPGDSGTAQAMNLNGSLLQTADGSLLADIDFATGNIDQVLATGSVDVDGVVRTQLLNSAAIPVGSFSQTLFRGEQGLTNNGLVLDSTPSVVVQYAMRYTDSEAILDYDIDFAAAGLGENLAAVGNYLNRGQIAGGGNAPYGNVISKLVFDPDLDTYRSSLSQLSPDFYAEHQVQLMNSTLDFAQRLMSCERPDGESRQTVDGSCVWVQMDQYSTRNDADGDYKAMDGTTGRYSLGAQTTLGSDWSLGFSLSRESNESDGYEASWRSRSETHQWGLMAAHRHGQSLWSGALTYGGSRAVTNRRGELVNTIGTRAERKMETYSGLFEFAHRIPVRDWYLKPSVSAGWVELRARASAESGAGALDLLLLDNNETHAWLRPAIEVGKHFQLGAAGQLNLNLELSAQEYLTSSTTDVKARLAGAPFEIVPLSVSADLGDPLYRARFGIDFLGSSNMRTQLYIDSGYHGRHDLDSVNLRFEFPLR